MTERMEEPDISREEGEAEQDAVAPTTPEYVESEAPTPAQEAVYEQSEASAGTEIEQAVVEALPSEGVDLEAATQEPEGTVEQLGDYVEAEAIEAELVEMIQPIIESTSDDEEYKVKVKFPWLLDSTDSDDDEDFESSWARITTGAESGTYILPEVEDEALLDPSSFDPGDHYAGVEMQGGEVLLDQDWNDGNEGGEPEVAQGEADSEVDVRADDAQEGWTSTIGEGAEGPPGEMAEAIPINIPYPRPDKLTEADDSISTEGAEGPPGELVEAIPINIPHPRPDKPTEADEVISTEGAEGPPGELVEAIPINIPHPRPDKPTEADEVISTEGADGPPGDLAEAIPINIPHPRPDSIEGEAQDDSRADEILDAELVVELERIEADLPEATRHKVAQAETVFQEHLISSTGPHDIYKLATNTVQAQFENLSESESDEIAAVVLSHTITTIKDLSSEAAEITELRGLAGMNQELLQAKFQDDRENAVEIIKLLMESYEGMQEAIKKIIARRSATTDALNDALHNS
jgi:hypothetical protein